VALEGVVAFAALCAPQFACLVKGAGRDLVAVRVVEADGVDYISVAIQCVQLFAGCRVPDFT